MRLGLKARNAGSNLEVITCRREDNATEQGNEGRGGGGEVAGA